MSIRQSLLGGESGPQPLSLKWVESGREVSTELGAQLRRHITVGGYGGAGRLQAQWRSR